MFAYHAFFEYVLFTHLWASKRLVDYVLEDGVVNGKLLFYTSSEELVNASFLSDHIAKKTFLGVKLRSFMNPLRRELRRLLKIR